MNKTRLLLLIFLIMSVSFIAKGCSFLPRTSLIILQYHLEKSVSEEGDLTAEILGVALNDGSARLEYAEIEGSFYGYDGTLLARGFAKSISEEEGFFTLDPGEIWDFSISYSSDVRDAHPSVNILSWYLKKDSSGARIDGEAENNGDVMLSFAEITGTFYDSAATKLGSGTATITSLAVGEIWEYTIWYPARDPEDVDYVAYAKAEVTETDYASEPAQDVDHATVEVGRLRGSTLMP